MNNQASSDSSLADIRTYANTEAQRENAHSSLAASFVESLHRCARRNESRKREPRKSTRMVVLPSVVRARARIYITQCRRVSAHSSRNVHERVADSRVARRMRSARRATAQSAKSRWFPATRTRRVRREGVRSLGCGNGPRARGS